MKRIAIVLALLLLPPALFGLFYQTATPSGVAKVEFFLDGQPFGPAVTTPPYEFQWDSTKVPNGQHTITARATDHAGNVGSSTPVTFTVANAAPPQDPPPVIYFITADGSYSGAEKKISLHVADNKAVHYCELLSNGVVYQTKRRDPPNRLSATTNFYFGDIVPKGTYTVGANCYDENGGKGSAAAISITKK